MSQGIIRDVLATKPFQTADLSQAVNDVELYVPHQVAQLNLFREEPLFTDVAYIEGREGKLSLIPTSQRGGPSTQVTRNRRNIRTVQTYRLSEEAQIQASELFRVTAFNQVAAQQNLTTLRNQYLAQMTDAMSFTDEHMDLNALKGDVLDADGTSLTNLFTLFGVSQESEVAFDLTSSTAGLLAKKIAAVKRLMYNNLERDSGRVNHIHALCSPEFFDDLLANRDVLAWAGVSPNSDHFQRSRVFGVFEWQGMVFEEYRLGTGAAAAATTAGGAFIAADKCIMFPVGPPIYVKYYSPGEFFGALDGTPGLPRYARAAADPKWDEYVELKLQSYPLPICLRPKALMKGKKGS
jgi:hypothetical protein